MLLSRYYYTQLSPVEKRVYDDIYIGLMVHKKHITSIGLKKPRNSMAKIMKAVLYDHPEFYYVRRDYSYAPGRTQTEIYVKYLYDAVQRKRIDRRITCKIKEITDPISHSGLDQYQKEKYLYEYFTSHYSYDHRQISKERKRDWYKKYSVLGVLEDNTAVCEGFAKTFKLIMDRLGMECMIVTGFSDHARAGNPGKDGSHAWNIIMISGRYYHVDVTWGICSSSPSQICFEYLNLTDKQIRRDHKGFGGVPICRSISSDFRG